MNNWGELKGLLSELTRLPGASGMEQKVVQKLRDELKPLADEVEVDSFGNVLATRRGDQKGPKMMLAAHSDEVGGVVTDILPGGFLKFQTVGVVNPGILPAARVLVANKFVGTVSSLSGHHYDDNNKPQIVPPGKLHIDIGGESDREVRSWGVNIGSSVVFESPLTELNNPRYLMGKAIDNRIGCALLIRIFSELDGEDLPLTLVGVINVLEEIGMRGAKMTTNQVMPDFAIALDTIPAEDTPMNKELNSNFKIGAGPVIQLVEGKAEQFLGTVAHPGVTDVILSAAAKEDISVQISASYDQWTTDGAAIHTSGPGIPTGFVSLPRRYAHSPNEILDLQDAEEAAQLLLRIIRDTGKNFNPSFIRNDG